MVYLQRWHGWCHVKLLPSRRVLCTPYVYGVYVRETEETLHWGKTHFKFGVETGNSGGFVCTVKSLDRAGGKLTSERQGGAHMGFPQCADTMLN